VNISWIRTHSISSPDYAKNTSGKEKLDAMKQQISNKQQELDQLKARLAALPVPQEGPATDAQAVASRRLENPYHCLFSCPSARLKLALCKILLGSLLEFSLMLPNGQKGQSMP